MRCVLDVLSNLELVTILDDAVLTLVLDTVGNVTTRAIEVAPVVLSVVGSEVVVTIGVVVLSVVAVVFPVVDKK